jgi:hypothetical protein
MMGGGTLVVRCSRVREIRSLVKWYDHIAGGSAGKLPAFGSLTASRLRLADEAAHDA